MNCPCLNKDYLSIEQMLLLVVLFHDRLAQGNGKSTPTFGLLQDCEGETGLEDSLKKENNKPLQ